jgi:hypothetical protein
MKRLFPAGILLVLLPLSVIGQGGGFPAYNIDSAWLSVEGARAGQVSSADRNGGNDDGNRSWSYIEARRREGLWTLFEATGPSAILRIWMTGWLNPGSFRMLSDGKPVVETREYGLFSGNIPGFPKPLVGDETDSSGAWFSYAPVAGEKSLLVDSDSPPNYLHIGFMDFADPAALAAWQARQAYRLTGIGAARMVQEGLVAPASPLQLGSFSGSGLLARTRLRLRSLPESGLFDESPLHALALRYVFDGTIVTEAPLSHFCGGSRYGETVKSIAAVVGREGNDVVVDILWPMPFARSVEISLHARPGSPSRQVQAEILVHQDDSVATMLAQGQGRYFRTSSIESVATETGKDVVLLATKGSGHLAGVVLEISVPPRKNRLILEGDERIRIDGVTAPQIHGTGTEDYFNGGWYYKHGPFSQPVHGVPTRIVDAKGDHISQYRWHIPDPLPFSQEISLSFEHGPRNDEDGVYHGTAFWYGDVRTTGVYGTLLDHQAAGSSVHVSAPWHGDARGPASTLAGHFYRPGGQGKAATILSFGIPADNTGVVLRKVTDLATGRFGQQRASVSVDGLPAGTWLVRGFNPSTLFSESEFLVPRELSTGKSTLTIHIEPSTAWDEFGYELIVFTPLQGGIR